MRFRNSPDLLLSIAVTLVALLSASLGLTSPILRTLLALPLVFVLPGYSLVALLLPHYSDQALRLMIAVALSISVTGVLGLLLNFTPWGLNPQTWLYGLSGITLIASILALIRRDGTPSVHPRTRLSIVQAALFGLAAVLVVFALIVARDGAARQVYPGFTQLWLVPADDSTQVSVQLGVRNEEAQPMTYRLVVYLDEAEAQVWDAIELTPDEQWEVRFALPPGQNGGSVVHARLYRVNQPDEVYRSVSLTFQQ